MRVLVTVPAAMALAGVLMVSSGLYLPAKAWLAQILLQQAWSRTLEGERQARPWPWADTHPVARLRMETSDVELIVLAGASGRTLAFGPAHLSASPLPGNPGNSVIAGHRDTHFRFLAALQLGDGFVVEGADGTIHRFVVDGATVADSRSNALRLDGEQRRLTLVTCYPFDAIDPGGALRYVVTAVLVEQTL